jgi:hypothetical protein
MPNLEKKSLIVSPMSSQRQCVCVGGGGTNEYREKMMKMIRIYGRDSQDLDFKIFLAVSDDKVPH